MSQYATPTEINQCVNNDDLGLTLPHECACELSGFGKTDTVDDGRANNACKAGYINGPHRII